MTPETLLDAIEGQVREHLPPGIAEADLERFLRRHRSPLIVLLAGLLPVLPVLEAILSGVGGYERPRLTAEQRAQNARAAAHIDTHILAELASVEAVTRDQENALHLAITEYLDEHLPRSVPWRNQLIVYDLSLRIWTFYRRRLLARGVRLLA